MDYLFTMHSNVTDEIRPYAQNWEYPNYIKCSFTYIAISIHW